MPTAIKDFALFIDHLMYVNVSPVNSHSFVYAPPSFIVSCLSSPFGRDSTQGQPNVMRGLLFHCFYQVPLGELDLKAGSDHGAVEPDPNRVSAACRHLYDIGPALKITLPVGIVSRSD